MEAEVAVGKDVELPGQRQGQRQGQRERRRVGRDRAQIRPGKRRREQNHTGSRPRPGNKSVPQKERDDTQ